MGPIDYKGRRGRGAGARATPPTAELRRHAVRRYSIAILLLFGVALAAWFGGRYYWQELRWRFIVVHHTASDYGNLEIFRRQHMEERGWSDVAYHFVVNNGTANTAMGQIEESEVWRERRAHHSTRIPYVNRFGIAVVMVGNFENHPPPPQQREALIHLLARLAIRHKIPVERIVGHRELQNTACPGKNLNMVELRSDIAEQIAATKGR